MHSKCCPIRTTVTKFHGNKSPLLQMKATRVHAMLCPIFAKQDTSIQPKPRLLFTHIYDMEIVNVTICGCILNVVPSVQQSPNFTEKNHPFGR